MKIKKTLKILLITITIVLIVFTVLLTVFYFKGMSEYQYSDDQLAALDELGNPDTFLITFSTDSDGNEERVEEWHYYDHGSSMFFFNGVLTVFDEIEPLPGNSFAASYEPDQFDSYMSWEDVKGELKDNTWEKASDYVPELLSDTGVELYYSDQIVVGIETDTKTLVFVETMPLVPGEEEFEEE
jgi:hypothetical protein